MTSKAGDSAKKKFYYNTNNDKAHLNILQLLIFSFINRSIVQSQCGIIAGERCKNE